MVREFEIGPRPGSAQLFPVACEGKQVRRMRVHERDLKKCAGNIELLKRYDIDKTEDTPLKLVLPGCRLAVTHKILARRRSLMGPATSAAVMGDAKQPMLRRRASLPQSFTAIESEVAAQMLEQPSPPVGDRSVFRRSLQGLKGLRAIKSSTTL